MSYIYSADLRSIGFGRVKALHRRHRACIHIMHIYIYIYIYAYIHIYIYIYIYIIRSYIRLYV